MKKQLGLLFGGRSGEHEVSLQSAKSIAGAVDRNKYELLLIAVSKSGEWFLADEQHYLDNADDPGAICLNLEKAKRVALVYQAGKNALINLDTNQVITSLDVAFPIIHGTFGEDGSLQGMLNMMNIPCVGADVLGSAAGMDKLIAKQLLLQDNIAVADYVLVNSFDNLDKKQEEITKKFNFPVFVKPACSGSSVGVYKAKDEDELATSIKKALQFDKRILVEESVIGREIECAVLGNDDLIASVPGEIIPNDGFYSYEAKYIDAEGAKLEAPAKLTDDEVKAVQEMALKTYRSLSCSGMARVDMFLLPDGKLVLNEINTLPGFTKISMYPKLMALTGIPYPELIDRLVELAIERQERQEGFLKNILAIKAY